MFFKVCGPLAQRKSQSKELKSFTKLKIGLQFNQSTAWRGLGRPGATLQPGMSSTTSTSSSRTWTEEHHQELQENQAIDHEQDNEAWWTSYSGSEAAEIAEYFATSSSATSSDEYGPETSPIKWCLLGTPENAGVHARVVGTWCAQRFFFLKKDVVHVLRIAPPPLAPPRVFKAYINSVLKTSMIWPGWGAIGNSGRELTQGCYALKQKYHVPCPLPPSFENSFIPPCTLKMISTTRRSF